MQGRNVYDDIRTRNKASFVNSKADSSTHKLKKKVDIEEDDLDASDDEEYKEPIKK